MATASTFTVIDEALYNKRGVVHGSKLRGDLQLAVQESAALLRRLIRRCEDNELPPRENACAIALGDAKQSLVPVLETSMQVRKSRQQGERM